MFGTIDQIQAEIQANAYIKQLTSENTGYRDEIKKLNRDYAFTLAQRAALQTSMRRMIGSNVFVEILNNADLWEKIGNAGVSAWIHTGKWEAVRTAGNTFKVPAEPNIYKNYVSAEQHAEQMRLFKERAILCNERTALCNSQARVIEMNIEKLKTKDNDIAFLNTTIENLKMNLMLAEHQITILENKNSSTASNKSSDDEIRKLTKACAEHMAQAAAFRQQLKEADPLNPLIVDAGLRQRLADVAYAQFEATKFQNWAVVKEVGSTFVSPAERSRASYPGDAG